MVTTGAIATVLPYMRAAFDEADTRLGYLLVPACLSAPCGRPAGCARGRRTEWCVPPYPAPRKPFVFVGLRLVDWVRADTGTRIAAASPAVAARIEATRYLAYLKSGADVVSGGDGRDTDWTGRATRGGCQCYARGWAWR